jgi:TolA-binding protein
MGDGGIMFRTLVLLLTIAAAASAQKPNRDIQELQRDIAQMQETVKALQQGLEQRFSALGEQIQGMAQATDKVNATVASLQKGLDQIAQDQKSNIVPVVAAQGARVEQMSGTVNTMQQAMSDLTSAINKLQTQIGDMGNTLKAMSTPAIAPPGSEKPPIGAADLINNAEGDRLGGKIELALQEYTQYLQWYSDTPMAHVAQFQIGMLHYASKDYEGAIKDFDTLVQKYPESAKAPDALFYKRKSLQLLGRNSEASAVCQELRKNYAGSDFAKQCVAAAAKK